ncbi:hypothetical protein AAFF_G00252700 [Aldrovandia affinis]|uniref:EGF-like domain-containing protein n=1 Tax=Aldrovandia affinis TaxID=143900 RepID=A0AAD7STS0_9TELE|nr:hypothetical protein AAFF_G00252700 [Aldrovandia affinis]
MATPVPQECNRQLCQDHGECFTRNGVSTCECRLGYRGAFCQDRVSDPIRVPLTLGVLGVLAGFILLGLLLMLIRKRRKASRRKMMGAATMIPMVDIDKAVP